MYQRGGQGDKDFGAWIVDQQLDGPTWDDAAAAMGRRVATCHSGAALNEGREMFPKGDNARFSAWLANTNLGFAVHCDDRAAATTCSMNGRSLLWASCPKQRTHKQPCEPQVTPRMTRGLVFGSSGKSTHPTWVRRFTVTMSSLDNGFPPTCRERTVMTEQQQRTVLRVAGVPATCWNGRHGLLTPTWVLQSTQPRQSSSDVASQLATPRVTNSSASGSPNRNLRLASLPTWKRGSTQRRT